MFTRSKALRGQRQKARRRAGAAGPPVRPPPRHPTWLCRTGAPTLPRRVLLRGGVREDTRDLESPHSQVPTGTRVLGPRKRELFLGRKGPTQDPRNFPQNGGRGEGEGGRGRDGGEGGGGQGGGGGDKAPPQASAPSAGSWCYSPKPPVPLSVHHGVPVPWGSLRDSCHSPEEAPSSQPLENPWGNPGSPVSPGLLQGRGEAGLARQPLVPREPWGIAAACLPHSEAGAICRAGTTGPRIPDKELEFSPMAS